MEFTIEGMQMSGERAKELLNELIEYVLMVEDYDEEKFYAVLKAHGFTFDDLYDLGLACGI